MEFSNTVWEVSGGESKRFITFSDNNKVQWLFGPLHGYVKEVEREGEAERGESKRSREIKRGRVREVEREREFE